METLGEAYENTWKHFDIKRLITLDIDELTGLIRSESHVAV